MLYFLHHALITLGVPASIVPLILLVSILFVTGVASWALMKITRIYLSSQALKVLRRSHFSWVKHLSKNKLFDKLSLMVPGLLLYIVTPSLARFGVLGVLLSRGGVILSSLYLVLIFSIILNAILNVIVDTYESYEISKKNPIRSYAQMVKIIVFITASILSLSIVLDKSPLVFLTGLGAIMAVMVLIFKDTIVGFIASIQLTFYDIIRIGDWITIAAFDADGDVEEISLNTVKVRNFDKTISIVPTAALLTNGVKNWRGMQEAGGRRIKRSINIDVSTIKFCADDMIERFKKIDLLTVPLCNRHEEIISFNRELIARQDIPVNGRMMTNIGVFRLYINEYLKHNKYLHQKGFTFMVRQLQPTESGLPIEIYTFTTDTQWINYEAIQADIFDHLLAAVSIFELKVFQNMTNFQASEQVSMKSVKKIQKAS